MKTVVEDYKKKNRGKDGAGGQRKKTVAMIASEQNQLVLFAKKQEAGAKVYDDCGVTHSGPCTKKANEQATGVNTGRGRGEGFKPNDKPEVVLGGAGRGAQQGPGRGARIMVPQGGAGRGAQGVVGGTACGSI